MVGATVGKINAGATRTKGLEAAGICQSNESLTTKVQTAGDAPGPLIGTMITLGQRGEIPQARGLTKRLTDVRDVIMNAVYNSDHLRSFLADDLWLTTHINRFLRIAPSGEIPVS